MEAEMRIIDPRDVDPLVLVLVVGLPVLGFILGLGLGGVVAALVLLAVLGGSRFVASLARRRFSLPPSGTQERALVMRAVAAAATMRRLVQTVPYGPVSNRCKAMEKQARAALPTIRTLALQACRVRVLAAGIPDEALKAERAQTMKLLKGNPEERLRTELESSLRSTEAQIGTGRRLRTLADELFARTRALVMSLDAVAAGLAELQAISASDPTAEPQIALASLSREIDALRGGLEEAQTFGRRAAAIHFLEV
jgi:hypothetical protein